MKLQRQSFTSFFIIRSRNQNSIIIIPNVTDIGEEACSLPQTLASLIPAATAIGSFLPEKLSELVLPASLPLRFKTRGGVIQGGEPILDIVPANDDLLIDAHVAPTDIDVVHPGLVAQVHLSAYAHLRNMPKLEGKVRSVSADRLRDDKTGASYFLARVEVDREQLSGLGMDVQLVPGMPAEVLIVTGERTLLAYLFQPFRDIFRRSLRET